MVAARRRAGIGWDDPQRNYNSKTFVGGVTLGDHGFFVQDLQAVPFTIPTDLSARKSYFFVGDRVLAMGTHMRGGTPGDATHTTLFQTRVRNGTLNGSIDGEYGGRDNNVEVRVSAGTQATLMTAPGQQLLPDRQHGGPALRETPPAQPDARLRAVAGRYVQSVPRPRNQAGRRTATGYVVNPVRPGRCGRPGRWRQTRQRLFRVIDDDRMHLVSFPGHQITAYAFYETVETGPDYLLAA